MKHLKYGEEIKETLEELRALQRRQSRPLAKRRLRFLMVLKSGECISQAQAGRLIGIKERASEKLWKLYRSQGMAVLLQKPRSGQPPKLDEQAKEALQTQLESYSIQTLKQACDFVLRNKGVAVSQAAMHYYFQAMGIKKKTSRPTNV